MGGVALTTKEIARELKKPRDYTAEYRVDVPEGEKGPWKVERFTISKERTLALMQITMSGRRAPMIGETYTRLVKAGASDPVMSDTPAEVVDHMEAIRQIEHRGGRVLINGLGLGLVLKAALACDNVTHVDVVEIDQDVIDLVGPHYDDSRLTIHHADAFKIKWEPNTHWDVAWHDIWPDLCTDYLPEMAKLKRSYGRRADWQGAWGQEYLQRHKRSYGW